METSTEHFTAADGLNNDTQFLHSSSLTDASTAFPDWLQKHPFSQDMITLPAIVYGVVITLVIVLISLFLQLQRKIAYSDWIRNYKPKQLRNAADNAEAVRPPDVKGHFLLGNGREFAEDAAGFLRGVGKQYGDIANIRLTFRRIAVLNDVHSFAAFGREPRFDFRPIVDQVNFNVFGYKVANVDDHKRRLMTYYKSSKMHDTVHQFDEYLTQTMAIYDQGDASKGIVNAHDFVVDTGFSAVFRTIFGGEASAANKDYYLFFKSYKKFMEYFNFLWLGFPLRMFSKALKAFTGMVDVHPSVKDMPSNEGVCAYLRKACEAMMAEGLSDKEIIGHNVEFTHVHINAIRLAYWMLLFTLSDKDAYTALQEEIDQLVKQRRATAGGDANDICLDVEDVERMTTLDSIFTETLRLVCGVLVIRGVTQDVSLKTSSGTTYDLKRGETIMFYPPAHHYDPEVFEEPKQFRWDRFVGSATFSKNGQPLRKPVIGFGTICLGQRFATYLAKWYLIRVMHRWDMDLCGQVPQVDLAYQGHEILPPKCDAQIKCQPRPESHNVRLRIAASRPDASPHELASMVTCHTKLTTNKADLCEPCES